MDRRSPQAIQYSIKILQEYECWGLCGEVKKFMGAWKYDQTDIERQSLIIPLHEQRSGAVHGYPITASDKRQTPAVTNCRSIFILINAQSIDPSAAFFDFAGTVCPQKLAKVVYLLQKLRTLVGVRNICAAF